MLLNLENTVNYLPPTDYAPIDRRTRCISSVTEYIDICKKLESKDSSEGTSKDASKGTSKGTSKDTSKDTSKEPHTLTAYELHRKERLLKTQKQKERFNALKESFNPSKDPNITTDRRCTLIIARIPYTTTESAIREKFREFNIQHIRIVPNRGYAFLTFPDYQTCSRVMHSTGGTLHLEDRPAILDYCKSMQPGFKPRKLGGGLGGRFSLKREKDELARNQALLKPRQDQRSVMTTRDSRYRQQQTQPSANVPHMNGRRLRQY
ncbi:hypothetical protein DASB73_034980 [Starmerella bacillaris]|uniref:RRM domain-containing protein n=1 Tax=Starmerella bacillaris TaxID=1247836 RepID=A0AAV5RM81_STABA|nr:hypothetical protein DASB73_034980 [Starmerella bacillaris]